MNLRKLSTLCAQRYPIGKVDFLAILGVKPKVFGHLLDPIYVYSGAKKKLVTP